MQWTKAFVHFDKFFTIVEQCNSNGAQRVTKLFVKKSKRKILIEISKENQPDINQQSVIYLCANTTP